jgi:hypothetical protein
MIFENVKDSNFKLVYDFLSGVSSIENIDDNVLKNAVIALENDRIVGCISFEEYDKFGLIRYFVFKKILSNDFLDELISKLMINANLMNLKKLVCVADTEQINELFISLGFEQINKKIFINEEKLENTSFSKSRLLYKTVS